MSGLVKLAVILLPGGAVLLAIAWLLRCRHSHEFLCARAEGMGLRCARCGRTRPHPWAMGQVGVPPAYLAPPTGQPSGPSGELTGIERERRRQAAQAASSEPPNRARLRVISRHGVER